MALLIAYGNGFYTVDQFLALECATTTMSGSICPCIDCTLERIAIATNEHDYNERHGIKPVAPKRTLRHRLNARYEAWVKRAGAWLAGRMR